MQSSEVHDQQSSTCSNDAPATGNAEFSKMTVHQLRDELKKRNATGFSKKNKAELIRQLEEMCQGENVPINTN